MIEVDHQILRGARLFFVEEAWFTYVHFVKCTIGGPGVRLGCCYLDDCDIRELAPWQIMDSFLDGRPIPEVTDPPSC